MTVQDCPEVATGLIVECIDDACIDFQWERVSACNPFEAAFANIQGDPGRATSESVAPSSVVAHDLVFGTIRVPEDGTAFPSLSASTTLAGAQLTINALDGTVPPQTIPIAGTPGSCGPVTSTCAPPALPGSCSSDSDCVAAGSCTSGAIGSACSSDGQCNVVGECDDTGFCKSGSAGLPCSNDVNCDISGQCVFLSSCVPPAAPGACSSDNDCVVEASCISARACTSAPFQPCNEDDQCAPSLDLDGTTTMSEPYFVLLSPVTVPIAADGSFEVPAQAAVFAAAGSLNSALGGAVEVSFLATNSSPIAGVYDEVGDNFTLAGTLQHLPESPLLPAAAGADFNVRMRFVGRPPVAEAGADRNAVCGEQIQLHGTATDPDNDIVFQQWLIDPNTPTTQTLPGADVTVSLGVGAHAATFQVRDSRAVFSEDSMVITVTNAPPTAAISANPTQECTSSAGADVSVSAAGSSDPDGLPLHAFYWRLGAPTSPIVAEGAQATLPLPMGRTTVVLEVVDACGSTAFTTTAIDVVDTTPPELTEFAYLGPACLWPPNHHYFVVDVNAHFSALISDRCSNATLTVLSASSNQPDDATGDGDTTNDVVVHPDHVCVRSERRGNSADARIYTIHVAAIDASGNTSDPSVQLRVGHDQAGLDRCLENVQTVDEGASVCQPAPPPNASTPPAGSSGEDADDGSSRSIGSDDDAGVNCSHAGHPSFFLVWLGFVQAWARRRRRA
ncbi:MAG: hypothetical protein AB2A00_25845 [Myxococcota bacterium]